jgi:predicted DNA-binding transcriptional regulator AlpA
MTSATKQPAEAAASRFIKSAAESFPRYGDKEAVAIMLDLSTRTVSNLMKEGCPYLALGKRRVRFDLGEVRTWLQEKYGVRRIGSLAGSASHGRNQ